MNKSRIVLFLLMFALWTALTRSFQWQDLLIGILVSLFIAWLIGDMFTSNPQKFAQGKRYFWFVACLPLLLWEMLKAGCIASFRVITPNSPDRTGVVIVKTSLRTESGLTFLAHLLALTQEVLSIDTDQETGCLHVYCVDMHAARDGGPLLKAVKRFETLLQKIFE